MRKHIEPFVDRDVSFKRLELKGIPGSYNYKMLLIDEDSGACTMSVQWDAGYRQPPSVSYSELEIFIMNGEMKVGETVWKKGGYFFVQRGVSPIAYGSLMETETQGLIAEMQNYITAEETTVLLEKSAEVGRLVNGLMNSLERKLTSDH